MSKIFLLLLSLIVLGSTKTHHEKGYSMHFESGTHIAKLVQQQGELVIGAKGGHGKLKYQFQGLPNNIRQEGNKLIIAGIENQKGQYVFRAKITDELGNSIQGRLRLIINGLVIKLEASEDAENQVIITREASQQNLQSVTSGSSQSGSAEGSLTLEQQASRLDVTSLYEEQVGLSGDHQILPASGRYPATSPEGDPATANIVPTVILNSRARYSAERDGRKITVDEVKRNAIFNRQIAANKAVANLLAIIQQLTANVNAAKADIVLLEKILAEAQAHNNACNDEIFRLTNIRTKIQNAVNKRTDKMNEVEAKIKELLPIIAQLTRKRDSLVEDRTTIENERSPNAARLAELEKELFQCQQSKKDLENKLSDLRNEIASVEAEIQGVKDDVEKAPAAIAQIEEQIPIVDDKIADLKAQLAAAEEEKAKLLSDKAMYNRMIEEANSKISLLEVKLSQLRDSIPTLERQIATQQAKCDRIQAELDALRNQIAENEADYKILTEEIRVQNGLIGDREDQVARMKESIKSLPVEIIALQKELNRILATLRRQYYICNDKADKVRKAKQNLAAMVLKYNTEAGYLLDANANLELARAEKELADEAVEEIIRTSTDANVFSIIPNGLGETDAGKPAGNNPSGSPLGPVKERNQVEHGSKVAIGDLGSYLSQAYGAGVDPTKPSTVSYVYPLSVITMQALTGQSEVGVFNADGEFIPAHKQKNGLSDFGCKNNQNMMEGEGRVKSVQERCIKIEMPNGQQIYLQISECSQMESTKEKHIVTIHDKVYFKGNKHQNGNVELQKMTCV